MIVGLELGGTKCVASLARGREVLDQRRVATADAATTMSALCAILDGWTASHPVEAIAEGAGAPGETLDEMRPIWNEVVHVLDRLVHTVVLIGAPDRVALRAAEA